VRKVVGIVFNQNSKSSPSPCDEDNPRIIHKLSETRILGVVPYTESLDKENKREGLKKISSQIDIESILYS
jgi:uncharacterized NAD-dependent epimerase/dehydratase family protein